MEHYSMNIEKTEKIKPNTAAYIINGQWTHYFSKDPVTGNLLGIIPAPNCWQIHVIPNETTYEDLHKQNSINIYKESIKLSDLPDNVDAMDQIKVFESNELYTDGKSIFKIQNSIMKIVANPKDFSKCPIIVTNEITGKDHTLMVNDLFPMNTIIMSQTMHNMVTNGTPLEQLYIRISMKYNPLIKKCANAGALIQSLNDNSDTTFIELLKKTLNDDDTQRKQNIYDDLMSRQGYDTNPSMFELLNDNLHFIIHSSRDQGITKRKSSEYSYTIIELKKIIKSIWYDNYENHNYKKQFENEKIWDLITVLYYISNHELWNIKA